MASRELFVWYRVRRESADAARTAVLALQRSLRREWPGLQARLLVRDDGETSTWMETYSLTARTDDDRGGVDGAVEAAIAAAAARSLDGLIEGQRHCEAFASVA
jgi:fructose-1,6-bisphosphatase/sedoheptulose 1,7-bisphosphatase-like protein